MAKASQIVSKKCYICRIVKKPNELRVYDSLNNGVREMVKEKYPKIKHEDEICKKDIRDFRLSYVEKIIATEKGELSDLDRRVIKSMVDHEILSTDINKQFEIRSTFGHRLADKMAEFGGSWFFLIMFAGVLGVWIFSNLYLLSKPFDPYPFIFLNLILSCLAAVQAPIILMSQNRKSEKDTMRGEHDYETDLKAELQIRNLNDKIDYLTQQQWKRLIDIQKIQLELLEELKNRKK